MAIDTFQMVWGSDTDTSYANDYQEVRQIKELADKLSIFILLVHHLRKQCDSNPFNKPSGTTGISGAVDVAFVRNKSKRNHSNATLICTGRNIEYQELERKFSKDSCTWELVADNAEEPMFLLPKKMFFLNHSLGEWFKKVYGDKGDRKTPFAIIRVQSANCTKEAKGGHSNEYE